MNVTEWKAKVEADVRADPEKFLNPSTLVQLKAQKTPLAQGSLGESVTISFAPDEAIEAYLTGKTTLDLCCLACVKLPFGIQQCAVPHNGPCNMCG